MEISGIGHTHAAANFCQIGANRWFGAAKHGKTELISANLGRLWIKFERAVKYALDTALAAYYNWRGGRTYPKFSCLHLLARLKIIVDVLLPPAQA